MLAQRLVGNGHSWRRPIAALASVLVIVVGCQGDAATPSLSASGSTPTTDATPTQPSPTSSAARSPVVSGATTGAWEPAGSMATPRADPHAVLLTDGRVLVIGNDMDAELWDPATDQWRTTEGLNGPRRAFVAVALSDGRALVTGGLNDIEQSYSSTYVYDPRPGQETWSKVGLLDTARTAPSAAALPDGRVLVAGGYFHVKPTSIDVAPDARLATYRIDAPAETTRSGQPFADIAPPNVGAALATAELFDPVAGNWSVTGPLIYARSGAAAVTLTDGRILVVGSSGGDGSVTVDPGAHESAEIYDPETGRFSLAGTLPDIDRPALEALGVPVPDSSPSPASVGTLIALSDGGAMLVGHGGWWKHQGEITRSLRFDPETQIWDEVGQPYAVSWDPSDVTGRVFVTPGVPRWNAFVAPLSNGLVLVAGGDAAFQSAAPTDRSAELYEPATDTWSPAPDMPDARGRGATVVLMDRSVLLVGGHVRQAPCGQGTDTPCGVDPATQQVELASAIRYVPSP